MSLNVINCNRCGKVCMRSVSELCQACLKDLENQYESCLNHLRDNRGISLQELSDGTEVPVKQIIRFIKEGRISIIQASSLSYPCEICHAPILEQSICPDCRKRLAKDYSDLKQDEQRKIGANQDAVKGDKFQIRDRLKDRS